MNSTLLKYQRVQDIKSLFFCNISAHSEAMSSIYHPFRKKVCFFEENAQGTPLIKVKVY